MNREEIIALAIECGDDWYSTLPADQDFLIRFAALVAAAEREACAKVCEKDSVGDDPACCTNTAHRVARAIRKMGEK